MGVVDCEFAVAALVSRGAVNYFAELFLNMTRSLEATCPNILIYATVGAANSIATIRSGTTFHDMSASRIPLRRS